MCDPAAGSGHFLVKADNTLGAELARIRSGDEYPAEAQIQAAKRDVLAHCIYAVDLNPMAVELCKVSLWINASVRDRPLSFLDHHIRCGNSLIGATPALIAGGIPYDAFDQNMVGNDRELTNAARRRNRQERSDFEASGAFQTSFLAVTFYELDGTVRREYLRITDLAADQPNLARERYAEYRTDAQTARARLVADTWTAAFFWPITEEAPDPPTFEALRRVEEEGLAALTEAQAQMVAALAEQYRFFHWYLEFPDVFGDGSASQDGDGGFDVVLGNPPWERIKLQEKEFFAGRDAKIANAGTAAQRRKLIARLPATNPSLHAAYAAALHDSETTGHFLRNSGRFPLTSGGDANTYAVFAGLARSLMNSQGRAGFVIQSGIATDYTYRGFFSDLIASKQLASFYDFENREALFPDMHRTHPHFCLLTMTGTARPVHQINLAFWCTNVGHLAEQDRRFELTEDDLALLNPNTRTVPVFRTRRDAELTRKLYRAAPVLHNEQMGENPWGISFLRMFDMTNDSNLFRRGSELEKDGFWLGPGNVYTKGDIQFLPLYEGKMVQMYDHRAASVVVNPDNLFRPAQPEPVTLAQHADVAFTPTFQFWVAGSDVAARLGQHKAAWHIAFKDVTSPTNERTFIALAVPPVGFGNKLPLLRANAASCTPLLLANLNSLPLDYATRQKIGGQTLNFFIVEQLPVLPPSAYEADWHGVSLKDFIKERVLELTYTAHDIKGFAEDMGYDGQPFVWDEEGRLHLRCQLDAIYFHLYGLTRDEAGEILDTFPIVKRQDEARYGSFRTKDLILSYYNAYAAGNMDAWVKG